MERRYIAVVVNDKLTAQVRVVSEHPEDDADRELLYTQSNVSQHLQAQLELVSAMDDVEKEIKRLTDLAKMRIKRDGIRQKLLRSRLSDKHKGEEIDAILSACDGNNGLMVKLLDAEWGVTPTTPSKPSAPPTVGSTPPSS